MEPEKSTPVAILPDALTGISSTFISPASVSALIKAKCPSPGEVSDGYHTFNELYDHRIQLYIKLAESHHTLQQCVINDLEPVWRSKAHSDGSVWAGWFLLGIGKEAGKQITYHLPISKWEECSFAETLEQAPAFDGHSSADVLARLKAL
jgi:hypothetical protein